MGKIDFSVVIPFYNEESNLEKLHKEVTSVLLGLPQESEIIYVDDGSTDESFKVLKEAIKKGSGKVKIKLVTLLRNFGQTAAVVAGIDNASGSLVSFLDADLQNDPEDIPRFLEKLNEGYDAVFGWRKEKKFSKSRRFYSSAANKIINWVFSYPYHDVGCSARVVKREYLADIKLYGELHRILPVLIYLKGAKIGEIVVKHRPRASGQSKYGFDRILKTLIDIISVKFLSAYGTKPAYVFGSLGLLSVLLGIFALVVEAFSRILLGVFIHSNFVFILSIFLILSGIQLVVMGLLAELQVRTYFESQRKPIYEIKEINKFVHSSD